MKKNPRISDFTVSDLIAKRKAKSPVFAAAFDEEMARYDLAQRLREARTSKKLTQEQLAKLAGTRQPNIARLESGRVLPHLDQLAKIARALGMRLELTLVEN
jgi:ribosome-binding protein aMBF1 (putative translation factor)